ncbi:MAG: PEP-CTERM sorting domain-containing protein [Desulfobacterales bacterium]|nr:PEP-CTERM sorting domain-containing protein [Desulfobacterales bacterium]
MRNCKMLLFSLLFLMALGTSTVTATTLGGDYIGSISTVTYKNAEYFDTSWISAGDSVSFSYTFEKNMDELKDSDFFFRLEVNDSIYWDESLMGSPYLVDVDLYSDGALKRIVIDEIGDHRPTPPLKSPHEWLWEPDDAFATFSFSNTGELTGYEYIAGWIDDFTGPKGSISFTYDMYETVPEPSAVILVLSGLICFAGSRRLRM